MNSNSKIDPFLLEILVCPLSKGGLIYDEDNNLLVSLDAKLAYEIKDGIPVMMIDQAIKLTDEELKKYEQD